MQHRPESAFGKFPTVVKLPLGQSLDEWQIGHGYKLVDASTLCQEMESKINLTFERQIKKADI